MNLQGYLHSVRQYRELSARKHKSYAPVIDKLTEQFISAQESAPSESRMDASAIEAMRDREYPVEYRSFPPSRPQE